jgi:uncharacterized protein YjbI with pentapeptide repeats
VANQQHLAILERGVSMWNLWRAANDPLLAPDLSGTDLSGKNLSGAHLYGANLANSRLAMTDLTRSWLTNASLIQSDLSGADLSGAHLVMADFRRTKLDGLNLEGATLGWTVFGFVDFSNVDGLSSVLHEGPSVIGIESIERTTRKFPASFLQGCGFSKKLIARLPSLLESEFRFYSCFISFSTHDQDFADALYSDLQMAGIRCWFAPHDVRSGRKLDEQLEEAIRMHDRVLLVLSQHSMDSEWVRTEIARARGKELRERRQVLFPISLVPFELIRSWKCFDADIGKDSAREIREYFIPDFSRWKDHRSYKEVLGRLIRDLKAE